MFVLLLSGELKESLTTFSHMKQEANRKLISATNSNETLPVHMKKSLCDVIKESGFEVKAEQRIAPPDQRPYEQKVEEFLLGFNLLGT